MVQSDIDTAQRIVRLETKLDFLIDRIDKLPPSPVCLAKHRELEDRLDDMDKWRNRVVGVVLMFNIVIVVFMDKIRNFFTSP
jgi:hypothetical protein